MDWVLRWYAVMRVEWVEREYKVYVWRKMETDEREGLRAVDQGGEGCIWMPLRGMSDEENNWE